MSYRVELPVFSGPLDLLLHLIRQQEVDIHEVRIANILEQYLEHLRVLQELDLGDLGDFVVMASTLMEIKSRELLPREEISMDEELDPRDELIQRLLEYKRYRDLSRRLERMSESRGRMLPARLAMPEPLLDREDEEDELDLGNVEIWALTAAFAKLLEETGAATTMHVGIEKRGVRFYIERTVDKVRDRSDVPFEELFDPTQGRYDLIGVFQILLELMKQGFLRAHQDACFGPITVAWVGPADITVDEIMDGHTGDDAWSPMQGEADALEDSAAEDPTAENPTAEKKGEAGF